MRMLIAAACTLLATPALAKDPGLGATTFTEYEAFLSPAQEPGEETDAPKALAKATGETVSSVPREQRKSRGWAQIRFTRDLTRAFVDIELKGVNPADILMFHVSCGPTGAVGPIVVDLGAMGSLPKTLANGKLSVELSNKDVNFIKALPKGMKPALPDACPAEPDNLAGVEQLARKGVLYLDLHTKAHTFYGEVRGQLYSPRD